MKELLQNYLGITELESQLLEVVEKLNNQVSSIHARLDSLENIITDSGRAISELESNPPAPHNTLAIEMILKRLDELEAKEAK